jgi:hypothetical protein
MKAAFGSMLGLRDLWSAVTQPEGAVGLISAPIQDVKRVVRDIGKGGRSLTRFAAGQTLDHALELFGDLTGVAPAPVDRAVGFGLDAVEGAPTARPRDVGQLGRGLLTGSTRPRVAR